VIRALRSAGFEGPYSGARHGVMVRGPRKVPIPNPHEGRHRRSPARQYPPAGGDQPWGVGAAL